MKVEIPSRRSSVNDSPNGFEVVIPAKRNFFQIAFLGFWTIGWACGETFAIKQLFFSHQGADFPDLFLFAWLGAWTVGGAFAIYCWFWMVAGKELIVLKAATLSYKRDIFGFGRIKDYELGHVVNLRVSAQSYNPFDMSAGMRFWGVGGGLLAFDYGAKTFRFGASIDEAEARDIIEEFKRRHNFGSAG